MDARANQIYLTEFYTSIRKNGSYASPGDIYAIFIM